MSIQPDAVGIYALTNHASTTQIDFPLGPGHNVFFGVQGGTPTYFGSNSVGEFGINVPMNGGCAVGCSGYFNVTNPDVVLSGNSSLIAHDIVGGSFSGFSAGGTSGSYGTLTIQGGPGVGTSTAGSNLSIAGGRSTGTANGGAIIFYTTPAGASAGTSLNSQKELARFTPTGNLGIGISSPDTQFQVATTTSNATTTVEFGKSGQSKGSCLIMYDDTGAKQYVSIHAGSLIVSANSCN
jgi:hypothetical protein